MNLLTKNSKILKTSKKEGVRLFNFGIPALQSIDGTITCPFAGKCKKFCYAQKGTYRFGNVKKVYEQRFEITRSKNFVSIMNAEIDCKKPDFVRIHDSGDYYNINYLKKWITIAKQNPTVKFYSYTNNVSMIKKVKLPDNFDIIFSDGGKDVKHIDYSKDRYAKIFKTTEELLAAGFSNASDNDLQATKWFNNNNKVGLIYH